MAISRIYDNPYSVAAAKRSRDAQAKRDAKRRARYEKMNALKKRVHSKKIETFFDEKDSLGRPIYRPGMGKDFYSTRAWLEIRYTILQKHGAICQCCGATKKDGVRIHVDHIRPRHRFPQLELVESNLQVLCEACNLGKGARFETDWRGDGASTRPSNSATG
jgi:hypothetical protein